MTAQTFRPRVYRSRPIRRRVRRWARRVRPDWFDLAAILVVVGAGIAVASMPSVVHVPGAVNAGANGLGMGSLAVVYMTVTLIRGFRPR